MKYTKTIRLLVFVRLMIPILVVIFLTSLACNLPLLTGQEPTVTVSRTREIIPSETALPLPTAPIPTEIPIAPTEVVQQSPPATVAGLSMAGPWLLLASQDRLWAANLDGSEPLLPLVNQASLSWFVQNVAVAPQGGYLAFTASWEADSLSHITLFVAKIPEMSAELITDLTSPVTEVPQNPSACDPVFEATRGIVIGSGMAWSPDGRKLAFIGAQDGTSSDVFLYSLDSAEVTRVSDEPSQAFDPAWSPDGKNILFFSADCFGTGAGFDMAGAWAADGDGNKVRELYKIPSDSLGENLVGWRSDREAVVETSSNCPGGNLRSIHLDTQKATSIFEGCYDEAVMAEDGTLAFVIDPDIAEDGQGGLYIYPAGGGEPIHNPDIPGYQIMYSDGYGSFIMVDTNFQAVAVDESGNPGMVMFLPELPIFSPSGAWWAAILGDTLVMGNEPSDGEDVYSGTISNVIWTNDPVSGKETLFFMGGRSSADMLFYAVRPPDFTPQPVKRVSVMGGLARSQMIYP